MICIMMYKQNEEYQILKCHVFVHASKALYQLYNLRMSHHETTHSRHILQLNLLASICVNIAVRTISTNEKCGVLKTWLARNKLQKLRTHHANWHRFVLLSSTMLILLCWCSTLLHSFSHTLCGVSFLVELQQTISAQNPIPAWKNMPMMAIIASLPLAISALSFLVFSAGSEEVNTLNPKSPAYAALPGVCSWETSQKAM